MFIHGGVGLLGTSLLFSLLKQGPFPHHTPQPCPPVLCDPGEEVARIITAWSSFPFAPPRSPQTKTAPAAPQLGNHCAWSSCTSPVSPRLQRLALPAGDDDKACSFCLEALWG